MTCTWLRLERGHLRTHTTTASPTMPLRRHPLCQHHRVVYLVLYTGLLTIFVDLLTISGDLLTIFVVILTIFGDFLMFLGPVIPARSVLLSSSTTRAQIASLVGPRTTSAPYARSASTARHDQSQGPGNNGLDGKGTTCFGESNARLSAWSTPGLRIAYGILHVCSHSAEFIGDDVCCRGGA